MSPLPDGLSQKDIDSLLQGRAVDAAPVAAPVEALLYDFRRPRRIPKERLSTIEAIYGRFALAMQGLLASRLRVPTDVSVASVEQATFAEFIFSLSNPCATFVFDLGGGLGGQGAVDIGNDFAFYLVDRLFGGPGEAGDLKRSLTPLERMVVKGVADRALGILADAWRDHLVLEPEQVGFESAPEALQIANRDDNVLVTNLEVRTGGTARPVAICLPLQSLEAFLTEASARHAPASASGADRAESRATIESTVRAGKLPVVARFPAFTVSMRTVADLRPGQILFTAHGVGVPLEVHVGGRARFRGTPGQVRRALGVRIDEAFIDASQNPVHSAPQGRLMP
jgi:flagellar motor switch protein FliM